MATYLDMILASHRSAAAADNRSIDDLVAHAIALPPARPFTAALAVDGISVIAEVKRRSPSKGELRADLVPSMLAKAYAAGGAACLSVLTDDQFFGGAAADLVEARAATDLPVLRKDFTVSDADVCDARIMGADAVLLIAAALSDDELRRFSSLAREVGIECLVEVHDEAELERALGVGADLIGVNQRDLTTFEVDTDRAVRVGVAVPDGVSKVAESGVSTPQQARRLAEAGFDAILVGEALVTADDPAAALEALRCS